MKIYPTMVTGDRLNIISEKPVEELALFSAEGKIVFQKRLNDVSGTVNISLPDLQSGFYIARLKMKDSYVNEKILIHRQ